MTDGLVIPNQQAGVQHCSMLTLLIKFPMFLIVMTVLYRTMEASLRLVVNSFNLVFICATVVVWLEFSELLLDPN